MTDTICAIATAPGGAIGIIRVSGPQAVEMTERIFRPQQQQRLSELASWHPYFGHIVTADGDVIDEVLTTVFRAPHSYTGEDSVEMSCHGSAYILQQIITLLLDNGCRLARGGEYTQRAFLNGKMDLSQAEAVADLIASTCASQHRVAMKQMKGGVSEDIRTLRDRLLHMATLLELELDFSDHEDLEFANREELLQLAATTDRHLTELCSSFRYGNAIKAGTPIAIIGEANAGKSTLLNALLREDRAIVSNIPGTTRDTLEEQLVIEGRLFRIIDTAGIRETENPIEQIGIQRTLEKMEQADILLCVLDATCAMSQLQALRPYLQRCLSGKMPPQLVLVVNKMDLTPTPIDKDLFLQEVEPLFAEASQEYSPLRLLSPIDILPISALSSADIGRLRQAISSHAATLPAEQTIITNERHYEALCKARQALRQAIEGLSLSLPTDLVSEDFKACIHHLSDIIGEISSSDILENIFKNFCVGK